MPSSSSFALRTATASDVPVILQCIQALAEYERLAHECVATEALLREWLFGDDAAAGVVIAVRGEEPAGFALWFRTFSTFLARPGIYLEDLFVFPAFRGQGLGRRLLEHLARTAVERGFGRLEWSVLDWNTDAIRFYESLGARPVSDWTRYRVSGDALASLGVASR
ncbi:MAG TPA: GNAT family N-acetyltransferase [Gemmatimonadaceae bacterium]|jgi:GNAT superfamily N-acetyltransferase